MSEICEQDYHDYARSQISIRSPGAWVAEHWGKRSRDYVVAEWKHEKVPETTSVLSGV